MMQNAEATGNKWDEIHASTQRQEEKQRNRNNEKIQDTGKYNSYLSSPEFNLLVHVLIY